MVWSVRFLNLAVQREVEALPDDMQARLIRVIDLIGTFGLTALRKPQVKHLTGKLWEIRLSGRGGIARVIYAAAIGQRVVLLRAFIKKTRRPPSAKFRSRLSG